MPPRPIREGLFTSTPQPELIVGRCADCHQPHFPASDFCPYCGADEVGRDTMGATGTLYLHTIVNTAPPGYSGPVPYGFGLVDLPGGLRVVSRLEAPDLALLHSGMALRLSVAPLFEDADANPVSSWCYVPETAEDS